jgi:repressor LexA
MNSVQQGIEKRQEILDFIISYIWEYGYPPTVREIGAGVNLKSTSSIHRQLRIMQKEGLIECDKGFGVPRAIRIPGYKFVKVGD